MWKAHSESYPESGLIEIDAGDCKRNLEYMQVIYHPGKYFMDQDCGCNLEYMQVIYHPEKYFIGRDCGCNLE